MCEHALIPACSDITARIQDPDTTTSDDANTEVISLHEFSVPTIDDDVVRSAGDAVTAS